MEFPFPAYSFYSAHTSASSYNYNSIKNSPTTFDLAFVIGLTTITVRVESHTEKIANFSFRMRVTRPENTIRSNLTKINERKP